MTTAHRPTFDPARGGTGRNEGDLAKLSAQYSARDMPSMTKLKYRDDVHGKDFRRALEEREARALKDKRPSSSTVPPKKIRIEDDPDADDPVDDGEDDSGSDESDSEDEAALLAELASIKKERAAEKAERDAREKAEQERIRREDLLHANPLLSTEGPSDFKVKRRWDDDVVFKNCAKGIDDRNKKPNFINDSIRSEFHRKFMEKYIK